MKKTLEQALEEIRNIKVTKLDKNIAYDQDEFHKWLHRDIKVNCHKIGNKKGKLFRKL